MDMRRLELLVPTLPRLEGLCTEELRRLKLPEVAVENGRVWCKAAPADTPWVNLNLHADERTLLVVGCYRTADFEALSKSCRVLPWEEFIPREGAFPVKRRSLSSQLHAVPVCQATLKKAAAIRLGEKYGLEALLESGALHQIQFSIMRDEIILMLDTTGVGLHKRGYRMVGVAASLRGTLAAVMMLLSRYWGRDPFCDPSCGSSTIVTETALTTKSRAPGLDRAFSAQKWRRLDSGLWLQAAGGAVDGEYDGAHDIWGGGIDPKAVAITRASAGEADVEDVVRFEVADAAAFHQDTPYNRVAISPPYGECILEKREAERLYRAFGRAMRTLPEGRRMSVLSSRTEFGRTLGRTASKERKLHSGMLRCDLFQYRR